MPYISRDASGAIDGVFANPQASFATEFLADDDPGILAFPSSPAPANIVPQDLMAQFTVDDAAKIQVAVSADPQVWLLWSSLQAQSEAMAITGSRFLAGWSALVTVLGQVRMDQIAVALGAKSLVA